MHEVYLLGIHLVKRDMVAGELPESQGSLSTGGEAVRRGS